MIPVRMINCEAQRVKALGQEIWYYENMEGGDGIALGRDVFEEEYCSTCHRIDGEGKTKGPDLSHTGSRLQEGYLREWVTDPEAFRPETIMPSVQANGNKLDDLVFYLMSLE